MSPGLKWDERFMALAKEVMSWSKDPRKKVGAVVVSPDGRRISLGFNGLPKGFPDDMVLDRETKNAYSLHAEDNAIAQAGTDLTGWTMYVTEQPCLRCALAIHRAGITRVVTIVRYRDGQQVESSWDAEQLAAKSFFSNYGVEIAYFAEEEIS